MGTQKEKEKEIYIIISATPTYPQAYPQNLSPLLGISGKFSFI